MPISDYDRKAAENRLFPDRPFPRLLSNDITPAKPSQRKPSSKSQKRRCDAHHSAKDAFEYDFMERQPFPQTDTSGGFMLELDGTVEVENPSEVLRNQSGIFEVTSPDGQVFQVTCNRGSNMRIRRIGASEKTTIAEPKRWRIQKLMSPVA
jgi:hypothetical protein